MKYCEICGSPLTMRENGPDGQVPYCETCGQFRFPRYNVAVSMIVMNANQSKILLIQQYGQKANILVAGYVNKGESAEEAVHREVMEELGMNVAQLRFNVSSYYEPTNTLMLNYAVTVEGEEPQPNEEIDKWNWFYIDDAKTQIKKDSLAERFLNHYLDFNYRRVTRLETAGREDVLESESDTRELTVKANLKSPGEREFLLQARELLDANPDKYFSVVALDIRNFKMFNEIYGWESGSQLLEYVDERLNLYYAKTAERAFGYMGGDNFCVLTVHEPSDQLREEVKKTLDKENQTTPFPIGFRVIYGVYLCKDYRENISFMYDCAISALEEIRDNVTIGYSFYDSDKHVQHVEDQKLLSDASKALNEGEFLFYVQPQVDMKSRKIIGGEALARWKHDNQLIPPVRFIPPMERTGYITILDQHIWEKVCAWQHSLMDRGIPQVPVSVNISRVDFYYMDVVQFFKDMLVKYKLPVDLIKLEVTESAYAEDLKFISKRIEQLKDEGFTILLDDFGSGYSALNSLQDMEFDVIKVDMKFMNMGNMGYNMTEFIMNTAKEIETLVISEGVETEQDVGELLKRGGRYAQGYYYYKPMPVEEFERLLIEQGE